MILKCTEIRLLSLNDIETLTAWFGPLDSLDLPPNDRKGVCFDYDDFMSIGYDIKTISENKDYDIEYIKDKIISIKELL
jgi:hypothetical protein